LLIRWAALGHIIGQFLLALAATMLLPVAWGLATGTGGLGLFLGAALLTAAAGGSLLAVLPVPERELKQREALLLVVLIWLATASFGSLPFVWSGYFRSVTDAVFETVSGFSTTGATILTDVEVLPEPVQLWRCFSHWLGGMGIVLLGIAILPLVGHGGMSLYRAEFSGAKSEKLKPRIAETALSLYKLYVAFTVAEFLALRVAGMTWFEALCHAFSTLGTGGFSTRNASVGGFHSPTIEWIVIVFMLIAGVSFVQHYRLFVERSPRSFFNDFEVRAYLLIAFAAIAVITPTLYWFNGFDLARSIRGAAFQVGAIITTTGFGTENFELWYPLAQMILFGLMFVGGCTGSTAGGIKIARVVLLARVVGREFRRMVERHGVFTVRLGGRVVPEVTIQSLLNLIYLALVVLTGSCLLLAAQGVDLLTSIAASVACMFNIGPGFGNVGPAENYAHLPALSKWVLMVCMVAGRLEFYTLIVILTPDFWKK
jgi:trk system potassium uptake protein TrkH